jgi:hypothetical protein
MKTYNVTLTGQQKHIRGKFYENVNANTVKLIIDEKQDIENCPIIKWDGNSYELNSDLYIEIKEN